MKESPINNHGVILYHDMYLKHRVDLLQKPGAVVKLPMVSRLMFNVLKTLHMFEPEMLADYKKSGVINTYIYEFTYKVFNARKRKVRVKKQVDTISKKIIVECYVDDKLIDNVVFLNRTLLKVFSFLTKHVSKLKPSQEDSI